MLDCIKDWMACLISCNSERVYRLDCTVKRSQFLAISERVYMLDCIKDWMACLISCNSERRVYRLDCTVKRSQLSQLFTFMNIHGTY
jgi:hypothetical protein